ncbi:class I SAM-dependent methyltransferase [Staphylococcus aureus]
MEKTRHERGVEKRDEALDVCLWYGDWTITLSKAVGPTGEVTGIDLVRICRVKKKLFNGKCLKFS